jgi:hypothetical protein
MFAPFIPALIFFALSCRTVPVGPVNVDDQVRRNARAQGLLDHAITIVRETDCNTPSPSVNRKVGMTATERSEVMTALDAAKTELASCSRKLEESQAFTKEVQSQMMKRDEEIRDLEFYARIGRWTVIIIGCILCALALGIALRIAVRRGLPIPFLGRFL